MTITNHPAKENILFIVNPASGKGNQATLVKKINKHIEPDKYNVIYEITQYRGHAYEIVEKYKEKGIKKMVAVGGDGTVNEIGSAIINTDISLGIIPRGTGNGLARFLSIPLKLKNAVKILNDPSIRNIDAARINDRYFFCTAGVGFDAHVGNIFDKYKNRRPVNYYIATVREFLTYKSRKYTLRYENKKIMVKSILITFANAGQYGNNIYISPDAKIDDGLLDVCILKPFPKSLMLPVGLKLIRKTLYRSKYLEVIKCKEIFLKKKKKIKCHFDGEQYEVGKKIKVKILPASLRVMVP